MQHPKALTTLAVLCLGLALAAEEPAATPTPVPTPTPRPRTLEDAAAGITLDRSGSDDGGEIVISNHNLDKMADGGLVTGCELRGGTRAPGRGAVRSDDGDEAERKLRWQQRYRKQEEAIRKLREKQAVLEAEIRVLERASGRRRDPLRLERARARLEQLGDRIALEERRLAELVRAARRDGAQPGWFR